MTPRQNIAAIAASTAEPPALRVLFPISEHFFVSVATACLWYGPPALSSALSSALLSALTSSCVKYQTRNTPKPTNSKRITIPTTILGLKEMTPKLKTEICLVNSRESNWATIDCVPGRDGGGRGGEGLSLLIPLVPYADFDFLILTLISGLCEQGEKNGKPIDRWLKYKARKSLFMFY